MRKGSFMKKKSFPILLLLALASCSTNVQKPTLDVPSLASSVDNDRFPASNQIDSSCFASINQYIKQLNTNSFYQTVESLPKDIRQNFATLIQDLKWKGINYQFIGYLGKTGNTEYALEIVPKERGKLSGTRFMIKESSLRNDKDQVQFLSGPNVIFLDQKSFKTLDDQFFVKLVENKNQFRPTLKEVTEKPVILPPHDAKKVVALNFRYQVKKNDFPKKIHTFYSKSLFTIFDQLPDDVLNDFYDVIKELEKKKISYNFVGHMGRDGSTKYSLEITPKASEHQINSIVAENARLLNSTRVIIQSSKDESSEIKYFRGPDAIFLDKSLIFNNDDELISMITKTYDDVIAAKTIKQREALEMINAFPHVGTIKIEVGAAHLPICNDCLQVDRYRSVMDYKLAEAKAKGIPADQVQPPKENHIFAVETRNGVVADARELPFKDGSVSIMVTKHLPWAAHQKEEVRKFIREVLTEYKRVLSKDGVSLILVNGDNDPAVLLKGHRDIALELGFDAIPIRGDDFSGYLLQHTYKD